MLFEEHEFFMHYDYWPDPMPPVIRKGKDIESQDVLIKKTMIVSKKSQSMKNCTPNAKESCIGKFLSNSYFLLINNQRKIQKAIKFEPLKHDYI